MCALPVCLSIFDQADLHPHWCHWGGVKCVKTCSPPPPSLSQWDNPCGCPQCSSSDLTFSTLLPAFTIPPLHPLSMSHHSVGLCFQQQTVIKSFLLYRMLGHGFQKPLILICNEIRPGTTKAHLMSPAGIQSNPLRFKLSSGEVNCFLQCDKAYECF